MKGFITLAIVVSLVGAQASSFITFEEETENEIDSEGVEHLWSEEGDVATKENDKVATEIVAGDTLTTSDTLDMLQNKDDLNDMYQSFQNFKDVEDCNNNTCTMCFGFLCFRMVYKNNTNEFQVAVGIATVQMTLIGIFPAAPFGCCELSSRYNTCITAENIKNNGSHICTDVTLAANLVPYRFPNVCMKL